MNKLSRGFTLIEVLVASLILFLVVTSMMTIYRGALLNSSQATQSLSLVNYIPHIRSSITESIRSTSFKTKTQGELFYQEIRFTWEANLMGNGRAFDLENMSFGATKVIPDIGQGATPLYLWKVDLVVEKENKQRQFEFWEVSW